MALPQEHLTSKEVDALQRFTVDPVGGVAIAFTPAEGNVGGFPIYVTVDGDTKRRTVVRGPSFLEDVSPTSKLEVDVSPGGGVQYDRWEITTLSAVSSGERPRHRTDKDGFLQVRNPGARLLFDINSNVTPVPFLTAFAGVASGLLYVSPTDPTNLLAELTAWDVSRFNNVLFCVDQLGATGLTWSMGASMVLTYATDGNMMEVLEAGTVNEFGSQSATPWPSNTPGFIHAGAPTTVSTDLTLATTRKLTHVQFAITFSLNTEVWETVDWGSHFLRLRGLAW